MSAATSPPTDAQSVGRAYTKSLKSAKQLQIIVPLIAISIYLYLGLHEASAQFAKAVTKYFYLQVALCWIPLWILCAAGSLLVSCYRLRLERKFKLSESPLGPWLLDSLKAQAVLFVLGGAIVEITFVSHALSPSHDWILAALLCSLLFLGVGELTPWLLSLFYAVEPLASDSLRTKLAVLADKAGIPAGKIYEWQISGRTRKANALVAGIGGGRRILVTDTLLNTLSEEEVEALVAHELGHYALHHTTKRVALQCLSFLGTFWLIDAGISSGVVSFTTENTSWTNLGLVPAIFLMWSFGYVYGAIFVAMLARKQEKTADLYGWKLIGGVDHFISAMQKLTNLNLVVFDKNSQWKYTHPATADRVEEAKKYARMSGFPDVAAVAAQTTE